MGSNRRQELWSLFGELPVELAELGSVDGRERREEEVAAVEEGRGEADEAGGEAERPGGSCGLCGWSWESREEQVGHVRSAWHSANLRRRLRGLDTLSEAHFDDASEDEDEAAQSSDDDDASVPRSTASLALLHPPSHSVYSIHRAVLGARASEAGPSDVQRLSASSPTSVLLLLAGGRFAGAVFRGAECVEHKTFVRYTERRKQGGAQAVKDGAKAPKSAGSTLRRYNQEALSQEVRQLLASWASHFRDAVSILVRFSSYHRPILFSDPSPLTKDDPRIHNIPIITRRPTLLETKRLHLRLHQLKAEGPLEEFLASRASPKRRPAPLMATKDRASRNYDFSLLEQSDDDEGHQADKPLRPKRNLPTKAPEEEGPKSLLSKEDSAELYTLCKSGDVGGVEELFGRLSLEGLERRHALDESGLKDGGSWLHLAARLSQPGLVRWMLDEGASPLTRNGAGQVAWQVAGSREVRAAMSDWRAEVGEAAWDWGRAQIPPPLSDEAEAARAAKLAEKRRKERERKKEKAKEAKAAAAVEDEKRRFLNLSDREKRAMAAEARLGLASRCFACAQEMARDQVPFEYNNNRFCSTACVRKHRQTAAQ